MTRLRLPFAVFIGLVALECGLLAFVDTVGLDSDDRTTVL